MPEAWDQQIEEVVHTALLLSDEERIRYLESACSTTEMRRAVENLLTRAVEETRDLRGFSEEELGRGLQGSGERVGPYRVLRPIGAGGMGTVYLAERIEGFHQQVALKVIHRGLSSMGEMIARFQAERQILANLNHPYIARLLDGGVTSDGLPYVAMELIEGVPIDFYVERHAPTVESRIEVFRKVCAAVSYAHRNMVIHRDIKPANILVARDGNPKLLDFGIAKLQQPANGDSPFPMTRTAVRLLTPEYASPEQVRGETVTSASDVYSLGVVLFQLLAGSRPYDLTGATLTQLETAICITDPEKPSAIAKRNGVSFHARLRGDLDTIILRALAKDPDRRYSNVDYLDDDLGRFLSALPVQARPDTFFYVAGKYIRRHRASFALVCSLAISVIAIVIGLIFFTVRLSAEKNLLNAERLQAEHVTAFLIDLFRVSDPSEAQGRSISARDILDRGSQKITRGLEREPTTESRILDVLGGVYTGLGAYDRALDLDEQALKIRRKTYPADSPEIAESEYSLASILYRRDQDYARGQKLAQDALRIRTKDFGPESVEAMQALDILGNLQRVQGDLKAARANLRRAYDTLRGRVGQDNLDTAEAAYDLGYALDNEGAYKEAEELLRISLAARRKLLGPADPLVLISLEGLAVALQQQGDLKQAELCLREVLAKRLQILSPTAPGVGAVTENLASVLQDEDNGPEAEKLYREALAIDTKVFGESGYETAITMNDLADLLVDLERYPEAERYARASGAVFARLFGLDHLDSIVSCDRLALILSHENKFAEADALETATVAHAAKAFGEGDARMAKYLGHLGLIKEDEGQLDGARAFISKAYSLAQSSQNSGLRANTELWWGEFLMHRKQLDQAKPQLQKAFELRQSLSGSDAVVTSAAELQFAKCLIAAGKCDAARPHLRHVLLVFKSKRGDRFPETVEASEQLRRCSPAPV